MKQVKAMTFDKWRKSDDVFAVTAGALSTFSLIANAYGKYIANLIAEAQRHECAKNIMRLGKDETALQVNRSDLVQLTFDGE